ncbi:putative glutamine transport system permease protein [Streptococcus pneumoniae]|nr:putative glutamine transport system permease protein [Streptococcus pneumoniae]
MYFPTSSALIEFLILAVLEQGDSYGYEISQTIKLIANINPNHSYLSQLDVTYKTPDLMSHFLPPHEVSFTFCCSSIVFPR